MLYRSLSRFSHTGFVDPRVARVARVLGWAQTFYVAVSAVVVAFGVIAGPWTLTIAGLGFLASSFAFGTIKKRLLNWEAL